MTIPSWHFDAGHRKCAVASGRESPFHSFGLRISDVSIASVIQVKKEISMEHLQKYYDEHAQQARQHENQRERITNIILSISGVLISFITFAELSPGALAASFTLIALGIFGFLFSGKHYERFKFHTAIMKRIRDEIDDLKKDASRTPVPLSRLRQEGEVKHYKDFRWPQFGGSNSEHQRTAASWIARQRVHVFWEAVPLIVAALGVALTAAILISAPSEKEPLKVKVVSSAAQQSAPRQPGALVPSGEPGRSPA